MPRMVNPPLVRRAQADLDVIDSLDHYLAESLSAAEGFIAFVGQSAFLQSLAGLKLDRHAVFTQDRHAVHTPDSRRAQTT